MKPQKLIVFCLAYALLIATVPSVLAVPPLPSSFYGTVKVNGANVPTGTVISAWVNGVQYAQAAVGLYAGDTIYTLDVPGDDLATPEVIEGGHEGDTIQFKIAGLQADQTGTWHTGTNVRLNLTRAGAGRVILQVAPTTLIANSGATAIITATVVDASSNPVSDVTLFGSTLPAALGSVSMVSPTNALGQAFGTWIAGSVAGMGLLSVGNGSITDTVPITLNNPSPAITTLNPTTVTAGSPPFTLFVTGTNFVHNSQVYWNGTVRPTTFDNGMRVRAAIDAENVTLTGTVSITVSNPAPGGGTSNVVTLTVVEPALGKFKVYLPLVFKNYRTTFGLAP